MLSRFLVFSILCLICACAGEPVDPAIDQQEENARRSCTYSESHEFNWGEDALGLMLHDICRDISGTHVPFFNIKPFFAPKFEVICQGFHSNPVRVSLTDLDYLPFWQSIRSAWLEPRGLLARSRETNEDGRAPHFLLRVTETEPAKHIVYMAAYYPLDYYEECTGREGELKDAFNSFAPFKTVANHLATQPYPDRPSFDL
jgi:hypothetical protein